MTRVRVRPAALALQAVAIAVLCGRPAAPQDGPAPGPPAREAAWRVVELPSGRVLDEGRPDVLARPAPPGSIAEVSALIAALESGTVTPAARIPCPGFATVGGRRVVCLHPRVRHPLAPSEALAYSCNVFFATIGERLPRERLNGVLTALGLPPVPVAGPGAVAAAGVEGTPVPPAAVLGAWQQVLSDPPGVSMRSPTRAAVHEGLRGAAVYGTADALRKRGVDALAKTGTARAPDGRQHGTAVIAWPADRPTRAAIVVLAGGSGSEAAQIAAGLARGERPALNPPPPAAPLARRGAAREPPPANVARPAPAGAAPAPAQPAAATVTRIEREDPAAVIRVGVLPGGDRRTIRPMPLEEYVARVLAGEAAPRSPPAALEALAITARTFALANRRRHALEGFDLCDRTHCQVLREPYAAVRAAAAATSGQVLSWRGAPAGVYYSASCGGRTERPSAVWPGADDPPFLPSRADRGCGGLPRWSAEIAATDLLRALRRAGLRGAAVRNLRVRRRAASGRVAVLETAGMSPGQISGQNLRVAVGRTLGWHLIKSTDFTLSRTARGYRFTGRGFGHGVGFCVIGATRRAAAGESRAALLAAYFPGTQVRATAGLRLPATPAATTPDGPPELASGDAVTAGDGATSVAPTVQSGLRRISEVHVIELFDNDTGAPLGRITEAQLQFLRDRLEEESPDDTDYYINRATLDLFEERGGEPALVELLRNALGARDDMEIRWERR